MLHWSLHRIREFAAQGGKWLLNCEAIELFPKAFSRRKKGFLKLSKREIV
jgi:hypothetical protein